MPWAVVQIVLVPGIPDAWKSTHFMSNPLTVRRDCVILSPAKPAASDRPCRNATQCDGVYRLTSWFCTAACAVPSLVHVRVFFAAELDVGAGEQLNSPEAFVMRSIPPVPVPTPDELSTNRSSFGGRTAYMITA